MITRAQVQKLKATGKVEDVEDEGLDEGRFFVHLTTSYSWDEGYGVQRTKSFGSFREARRTLRGVVYTPSNERTAAAFNASGVFAPVFTCIGKD